MKNILWLLVLVSNITLGQGMNEYPMGPREELTPGELCSQPSRYRYPENIAYCERDVSSQEKEEVFAEYRKLGFRLSGNRRSSYKVDHYIPLCAGGSNGKENLWPQHISVGQQTDDLEQLGCQKMSLGLITQAKFVILIKRAKNTLSEAPKVRKELQALK